MARPSRRSLARLLLAVVLSICAGVGASPSSSPNTDAVLELTAATFEPAVRAHAFIAVAFVAPWCAHCKRLEPEWAKAAETLAGGAKITLAKIDATAGENAEVAKAHDVPALERERPRGGSVEHDPGSRAVGRGPRGRARGTRRACAGRHLRIRDRGRAPSRAGEIRGVHDGDGRDAVVYGDYHGRGQRQVAQAAKHRAGAREREGARARVRGSGAMTGGNTSTAPGRRRTRRR